ncbi:hypothetical protein MRX96_013012 [Rhipicephalus microplus]
MRPSPLSVAAADDPDCAQSPHHTHVSRARVDAAHTALRLDAIREKGFFRAIPVPAACATPYRGEIGQRERLAERKKRKN